VKAIIRHLAKDGWLRSGYVSNASYADYLTATGGYNIAVTPTSNAVRRASSYAP